MSIEIKKFYFRNATDDELGFKPYIADTVWQVETEKSAAYLSQPS